MGLLHIFVATAGLCSIGVTSAFTGIATTYGPPDGESPQGGNCAMMKWLPLAPQFHVAINDNQYDTGANCGRCVSVTCVDARCQSKRTVLGQVTDRCPECSQGDLDMSLPMFQQVTGFTTDRLAISWEFVDCPVTDGVQVCAKDGSSIHWLYVQPGNTLNGVKSMRINGGDAPLFGSAYYFMSTVLGAVNLSQTQVEMTSHSGQTIKATVALVANQCTQISQQFSGCGLLKYPLLKYPLLKYPLLKYLLLNYPLLKYPLLKYRLLNYQLLNHQLLNHQLLKFLLPKYRLLKYRLLNHQLLNHQLLKFLPLKYRLPKYPPLKYRLPKYQPLKYRLLKNLLLSHRPPDPPYQLGHPPVASSPTTPSSVPTVTAKSDTVSVRQSAATSDASGSILIITIAFIAVGVGMYVVVVQRARRGLAKDKNANALSEIPILETPTSRAVSIL
ncbi:hypothetical protein DYB37_007160 [Aphanomyces astaci]|uniref:Expansin-like EG45 domain-containing protein n=1 Tax=Aphanomyces astaci TaxID=112090 RepID=A0A3R7ASW7_APHAT|nr:hypothetical protein DYB35_010537 [Aphanomyces astaci]RHZ06331.1 hypothetical protein DYB37_007160 [Aphanomyces astaci]